MWEEIVRFGNKNYVIVMEFDDAVHNFMDVFHVSENVCGGEHARFALTGEGGFDSGAVEERNLGVDSSIQGKLAGICGFNAEDTAGFGEVAEQGAVIGTNVHDQIGG